MTTASAPPDALSKRLFALALGAVGVVYGDIGTSPLYTMKETFGEHGGVPLTPDNVLGVLSLVFWSLVLIVSFKYAGFIMRADNKGEGGIMSLMSLAHRSVRSSARARWWIMVLGIFGASLFFGDSVITPAISVLSAVEGLKLVNPGFADYVVPISLLILVGLFVGTSATDPVISAPGRNFGVAMALLFVALPGICWMNRERISRHASLPSLAIGLGVAAVVFTLFAWPVQKSYFENRYQDFELTDGSGLTSPYRWAARITDSTIALAGTTAGFKQYGFFGPDLSNRVVYIGREAPAGGFDAIGNCEEFIRAVNAVHVLNQCHLMTVHFNQRIRIT